MFLPGTSDMTTGARVLGAIGTLNADGQPDAKSIRELNIQRGLDIVMSLGALIFFAPLMMGIALLIKLQDGGPVLFGHTRIGRDGRSFKCWKFRSMVVDAEARLKALLDRDPVARLEWEADHKLRTDPRITALGRFLRVSSLDELPQLLNILKGEMSVVGPRPIVAAEIEKYGRWFSRYAAVKPGLTGLWQVSGRNDVSYRQRVALDILYVRRESLALYIGIILKTIPAVLRRSGSY